MKKAINTYVNSEGVTVSVYAYRKPRTTERTWKAIKGSIFNTGAKANTLVSLGLNIHKRG
jgi:hypothetical protein